MIEIQYDPTVKQKVEESLLIHAARAALAHQSAPKDSTLNILLTDNARIQSLNRDYRHVDSPTDVLSFDLHERDPETGLLHLGEIVVSIPYAAKQAKKNNHPLEAELQLLVVHGVLHILGHDHAKMDEKSKMWAAQSEILEQLGLADIKIQEI